jgi:succinate-acetate transporter protein
MLLGGFLEFILGNTFPSVVFSSFGAFWLSFAATLQPFYNAYGAYSPDPSLPGEGLATVGFNSSFAFFQVFMGLLCFIYLICSIRTNVVFMVIFLSLVCAFGCLAGAFFQLGNAYAASARGDAAMGAMHAKTAGRCVVAGGAFTFVTSMAGWWIFFAILLASVDFPFNLPVGDLSTMIKGASERRKAKDMA